MIVKPKCCPTDHVKRRSPPWYWLVHGWLRLPSLGITTLVRLALHSMIFSGPEIPRALLFRGQAVRQSQSTDSGYHIHHFGGNSIKPGGKKPHFQRVRSFFHKVRSIMTFPSRYARGGGQYHGVIAGHLPVSFSRPQASSYRRPLQAILVDSSGTPHTHTCALRPYHFASQLPIPQRDLPL